MTHEEKMEILKQAAGLGATVSFYENTEPVITNIGIKELKKQKILELAEKIFLIWVKDHQDEIGHEGAQAIIEGSIATINTAKIFYEEAEKRGLIGGVKNENDNG